jgi:PIN domain nuclease of toxin-antitoxin system
MNYILDTCAYYWLVDEQKELSPAALSAILDSNSSLHLSAITVTEIHRLVRKGRISIHAPKGLDDWFRKGLTQHQIVCEPITLEIAHAAEMLPPIHNDPADRFVLATAQIIGAKILSPDMTLAKYPNADVVW